MINKEITFEEFQKFIKNYEAFLNDFKNTLEEDEIIDYISYMFDVKKD